MPRKIKVLWVGCILIVFFSFVYFSIQGNIKVHRDKEEARVKQEFRIKKKKMVMEIYYEMNSVILKRLITIIFK